MCLQRPKHVPVELLQLGLQSWLRIRQSSKASASYRQSMDAAVWDLVLELQNHLPDGPRMEIREYKRARRSESREVAAKHNNEMLGGRSCTLLNSILDKMVECEARKKRKKLG